ncbi:MAG: hypothetical protein DME49_10995 [Verrucomicrobia bacterium]|nr:MAG: hypothetical protein DME49_10995 [Verrucomicrobiota bacterium]
MNKSVAEGQRNIMTAFNVAFRMRRDLLVAVLNAKHLKHLTLLRIPSAREIVLFRYRRCLFIAFQISLT